MRIRQLNPLRLLHMEARRFPTETTIVLLAYPSSLPVSSAASLATKPSIQQNDLVDASSVNHRPAQIMLCSGTMQDLASLQLSRNMV